jgi:hypothetical protein
MGTEWNPYSNQSDESIALDACNDLFRFSNSYRPIFGYLSAALCLFGIPTNIVNIVVLTRPNLIKSPTNLILTGLAISDLLTMLSCLPYSLWFYILHPVQYYCSQASGDMPERDTKFWTIYSLIHINFRFVTYFGCAAENAVIVLLP